MPSRTTQPGAGLQQLPERQRPEPFPDTVGSAGDQRVQGRDGPGAEFNRLRAGGQQHPNGLPFSAAARLAEADTGERLPSRSHGVDVVALHPGTTRRPLGTVDLNDPRTPGEQRRGQAGTEAAGAFDGPQRRVVALPEGN
ncbi:MAG TPA: hypothetical protein VNT27_15945 [Propionibacteriaceae bacterium]|nr:hypothetical protein [Propionibacteriaceae bacterium]